MAVTAARSESAEPIVKWPGGKTRLLPELLARLPSRWNAEAARELVARGCHVMLSNSDTPLIHSLYAGFRIDRVRCSRSINSVGDRRGDVAELIIRG